MLRDKAPGTFVVRDSNSFPGAFGLALKVATPPPGVAPGKRFVYPLIENCLASLEWIIQNKAVRLFVHAAWQV
ncbi:unnamed protein product [Strongylus vulgaris]|uniref:Uncharacterized protein n=1 Tax=Strongylus vulgaris TaxID=40348 RepID=A0A3P7L2P1_STRVU|nr:unnamed protein product [Strongylus vulgaris]